MITSELLRLVIGLVLMSVSCLIALRYGDIPVRLAAALCALCWIGTTVAELTTGMRAEAVIAGNAIGGFGVLYLAASYSNGWLWLITGVEAGLFMVQAWFYGASDRPVAALIVLNNVLATANLILLVIAALRSRRAPLDANVADEA